MIFVTVGTDQPFDRLIKAVDRWAQASGRTDVVAQTGRSTYKPTHMTAHAFLDPIRFQQYFKSADLVVAHAGMGTILSALRFEKPVLVMPRKATLGEQRNEHQLATATHLQRMGKVTVAFDEAELLAFLDRPEQLTAKTPIGAYADVKLLDAIRGFIDGASSNRFTTARAGEKSTLRLGNESHSS